MVNFRSLPEAPVADEPSNPFWLPRQPAAEFVQSLVDTLEIEDYSVDPRSREDHFSHLRKLYAVKLVEAIKCQENDHDLSSRHGPREQINYYVSPTHTTASRTYSTANQYPDSRAFSQGTGDFTSVADRYPDLLRSKAVRVPINESQSSQMSSFDISRGEALNLEQSLASSQPVPTASPPAYKRVHSTRWTTITNRSGVTLSGLRPTRNVLGEYARALQELEDQLYGPDYGPCDTDSVAILLSDLDSLLPGVRLRRGFSAATGGGIDVSYQTVLDYLSDQGHIWPVTLELFRALQGITRLDLRSSLRPALLVAPDSLLEDVLSGASPQVLTVVLAARILITTS
ncbi:uncharacterized protein EI90DRAFT_2293909 [Cantharellus anzutake]|uniref:uncharacterized protein n=1 Tax=Cantharellus anzutake TaxID=1750568 RepID=UPI0019044BD6|nr:uncharacterized protein EI90DRAFT_2293909 [Cantharellus anzutake]KAF8339852.1 hypothetical protein EI90DRAFT_2293909 [Cantharellus anzutake]